MENWKEEKVNPTKKSLWQRLAALAAAAALLCAAIDYFTKEKENDD